MEEKFLAHLLDLYIKKNPQYFDKANGAYLRENSVGYVRLCDSSGDVLLKIKKDDLIDKIKAKEKLNASKAAKALEEESWKKQLKVINEMCEADEIAIVSGEMKSDHFLAFHKANKEFHIQHRMPTSRPKHLVNGAMENWRIIQRESASDVVVEAIGTEQKKDVMGAAVNGIAMGFLFGGAGMLAGSASGNYKNVLFKLTSQYLGEFVCEAKYDTFKLILASSMART